MARPRVVNAVMTSGTATPLGAVWMAWVALPILISILEDETVCTLQAIWTFFHTVRAILKMGALGTVVRSRSMACEDAIFHLLTLGVTLHTDGAILKLPKFTIKEVTGLYAGPPPAEATAGQALVWPGSPAAIA